MSFCSYVFSRRRCGSRNSIIFTAACRECLIILKPTSRPQHIDGVNLCFDQYMLKVCVVFILPMYLLPPNWSSSSQSRIKNSTCTFFVTSVVAIGTKTWSPLSNSGPTTPTGMGTYPHTISQFAPKIRS